METEQFGCILRRHIPTLPEHSVVVEVNSDFVQFCLREYQQFLHNGNHAIRYSLLDFIRDRVGAATLSRIRYFRSDPTQMSRDGGDLHYGYLLTWGSAGGLTYSRLANGFDPEPVFSWKGS